MLCFTVLKGKANLGERTVKMKKKLKVVIYVVVIVILSITYFIYLQSTSIGNAKRYGFTMISKLPLPYINCRKILMRAGYATESTGERSAFYTKDNVQVLLLIFDKKYYDSIPMVVSIGYSFVPGSDTIIIEGTPLGKLFKDCNIPTIAITSEGTNGKIEYMWRYNVSANQVGFFFMEFDKKGVCIYAKYAVLNKYRR